MVGRFFWQRCKVPERQCVFKSRLCVLLAVDFLIPEDQILSAGVDIGNCLTVRTSVPYLFSVLGFC